MRITIATDDMKRIMGVCTRMCAGKNDAREMLSHICLRLHYDGTAEAVGLDGYAMGICYFNYVLQDGDADEYEMLIDAVKVPKSNVCTIERNGDDIMIEFDNGQIYMQRVKQGKYIEIDRLQSKEKQPTLQIAFNPKLLANALTAVKDNEYVYLTFTNKIQAVFIDGIDCRAMVLPKRIGQIEEANMLDVISGRMK